MRHTDDIINNGKTLTEILRMHDMWLRVEKGGVRAKLSGADLSEADLSGADLSEADLRGADLSEADLREADLRWADLRWADLRWANLREANLRYCIGNMREVKSLQIEKWSISYTHDTLNIGCQSHAIDKWRKWDTEAGRKWTAQMDDEAPEWAERLLPLVLQIIEASPAIKPGVKA